MATYLIIGDGAAGAAAAQALRQRDPEATITIISEDPSPFYYRAALTNFLIGQLRDDQLWGLPPGSYVQQRIGRFVGRVTGVDAARNLVLLESGQQIPYDYLLIASGSAPVALKAPGTELPGVMTLRTLQDVRQMLDIMPGLRQAVVVGGGTLGLEWVQGLRHKGVDVTYLLRDKLFWPRFLDETGSEIVFQRLRAAGVHLILGDEVAVVEPGVGVSAGRVNQVMTRNGTRIACQLLGVAIGVRPNVEFLKGGAVRTNHGIWADQFLRTNVPNIYTAGDVAHIRHSVSGEDTPPIGLWQPARRQGLVAGVNMVLNERILPYEPGALVQATHLYDIDFAAVGRTNAGDGDEALTIRAEPYTYRKLVLRNDRVAGALFIGDRRGIFAFKQLIDGGYDVASIRSRLLDPHFDLLDWMAKNRPAAKPSAPQSGVQVSDTNRHTAFGVLPPVSHTQPSRAVVQPDSAGPRLEIEGRSFPLVAGRSLVIGREAACDIVVANPSLSRRHAEIIAEPDGFAIRDLGSANGTWLGVTRLRPHVPAPIAPGDTLKFGQVFATFQGAGARVPTAPLPAAAQISTISGPHGTTTLTKDVTSFGRGAENDIPVPSQKASRLHAQIIRGDGALYLYDMGSTNGTLVNGARIVDAHRLAHGDAFEVGGVRYVFRDSSGPSIPGPASSWVADLTVVSGSNAGTRYALRSGETTLGREPGPGNAIVLPDPLSSRRNTLILGAADRYVVRDLSSRNGTRVNGNRLSQQQPLHDGDTIDIGQTKLVFHLVKS